MGRRKGSNRIYWRERGGESRAYGDFRDFSDVGGGREALKVQGAKKATTDPEVAEKLAGDRVDELRKKRRRKALHGIVEEKDLKEFASHHLVEKAKSGNSTDRWLQVVEGHLAEAVDFFGAERDLNEIRVSDVQRYIAYLRDRPNGRGQRCPECDEKGEVSASEPVATCPECGDEWKVGTLSESSVRKYLNSLSNLYRRAEAEEYVPSGFNPVASLLEKPTPERTEPEWLEIHEAALLLEAARTYEPDEEQEAISFAYPLVATFLLTGGRRAEVLGLEVSDVSFDRKTVRFRPNEHRRLKTDSSDRSVPLWPQLEEILRPYVFGGDTPPSGLLFPSPRTGKMIKDTRRLLDTLAERIGLEKGSIRTKAFRHTYCGTRLQTLDHGHPVAPYTVATELGHQSTQMVDRVYSHLGEIRQRSESVEYRAEKFREELGERLTALRAVA